MAIGQSRVVSITDSTEPVSLSEAKNYLRVTNTQDDTKITSQISAARAIAESYLNRDILPREREQFVPEIPNGDTIELYGTPIDSSTSIVVEINGDSTTEDNEWEKYGLEYDQKIKIENSYAKNIKIEYSTEGLQDDDAVKQGVLSILAELYEYGEVVNKWVWAPLKSIQKPYF